MNIDKNEVAVEIAGHKITWDQIRNLLCSALEGGSNYWYTIDKFVPPEGGARPWPGEDHIFRHLDYPCMPGGSLVIEARDNDHPKEAFKPVNRETLVEGMKLMARNYTQHFADFVGESDDACTGDVFLQCACLGELVYG